MNEIMTIQGIEFYEVEGTAYLKLETVARGLDINKTDRKENAEYKRVNRQALQKWLFSFGILNSENDELPEFIPENVFYRLAMKARNETAEAFQALIADEIIPAIRKHGAYIAPGAQPQGVEAAALQAVVQPIAAALEALTGVVQAMNQRLDGLEQGRNEMKSLPPPPDRNPFDDDNPFADPPKPSSILARKLWMKLVNEKLELLAQRFGKSHNAILHKIYRDLEEYFKIVLDEERCRVMEEHGLDKCSVLLAIFFDPELRDYFQRTVDYNLAPENRGW